MEMSSRTALAVLIALCIATAGSALDWRSFAASTDSNSDTLLSDTFLSADTETRLALCDGVGMRNDPFDARIIDLVASGHRGNASWDPDVFLRPLLASIFNTERGETVLKARIGANAAALDTLFARIADWRDPQLTEILVGLAPICEGTVRLGALMKVGTALLRALSVNGGLLAPQMRSLALAYLSTVSAIRGEDFLFVCTEMARLSRDKDVVDRARVTARALIAPASFLLDSGNARTLEGLLNTGSGGLPS
jgi:hypothetical protein